MFLVFSLTEWDISFYLAEKIICQFYFLFYASKCLEIDLDLDLDSILRSNLD